MLQMTLDFGGTSGWKFFGIGSLTEAETAVEVLVEQTVYQMDRLCKCSSKGVQFYSRFRFSTFNINVCVGRRTNVLQSPLFKFFTLVLHCTTRFTTPIAKRP